MNVYKVTNEQEFLDLTTDYGITFKNDSMVVIKPVIGFKSIIAYNDNYNIATECFPITKESDEWAFQPMYSTPHVPRNQQATTSVTFNPGEVVYFNLDKHDMLLLVPDKKIIIMILGNNKPFIEWLLQQVYDKEL